jgi:hypothetical protein
VEAHTVVGRRSSHIFKKMAVRLSPLRAGCPERFLVLISVRGRANPRAVVRLEELGYVEKYNDLIVNLPRDLPGQGISD